MGDQPTADRLRYLLEQYRAGTCTRTEMEELFQLVKQGEDRDLLTVLQEHWENSREAKPAEGTDWDGFFLSMMAGARKMEEEKTPAGNRSRWERRWLVAASLLFLVAGGSIVARLLRAHSPEPAKPLIQAGRFKNDVQPGGNKAILTLANGSSIVLDSAHNGMLTTQGATRIVKLTNGQLAYRGNKGNAADEEPIYNSISTPRGGQYQVVLPDGTRVWLDASSSLRFPTIFKGASREVQLTGEAYFEVAVNAHQPFRVTVFAEAPGKGRTLQHVEVLGTQFNVMAYPDEARVKTTLLTGAVRVGDASEPPVMLKPGEQAQLNREQATGMTVITDADVDAAVAWKNGYFDFNKANIETIMRQLARWYDVEVSFRGNGSREKLFYGGIQRDLPLSSVFRILERSGVQFSIDGKKVVVDL